MAEFNDTLLHPGRVHQHAHGEIGGFLQHDLEFLVRLHPEQEVAARFRSAYLAEEAAQVHNAHLHPFHETELVLVLHRAPQPDARIGEEMHVTRHDLALTDVLRAQVDQPVVMTGRSGTHRVLHVLLDREGIAAFSIAFRVLQHRSFIVQ